MVQRINQRLVRGCAMTVDTLLRHVSPGPAESVAITLSLCARYAIESTASKEAWLKDCDTVWEGQLKAVEVEKKQRESLLKMVQPAQAEENKTVAQEIRDQATAEPTTDDVEIAPKLDDVSVPPSAS
jgi:hypothetical protein